MAQWLSLGTWRHLVQQTCFLDLVSKGGNLVASPGSVIIVPGYKPTASPSMSLPSDRMPATPPWHLAVKQEWCVVDRAAQSGKALAERWEAAFLAQVPPPGFEPTFLFSPFSNSLFLRQDLAKRELFYVMKTPVTEKWDLGPKWCVESRSPATLCKVLIGDTGASSLAPDHEHPTWELQQ